MLDLQMARKVKKAVDAYYKGVGPLGLEDILRMENIEVSKKHGGYNILAMQSGDLTILVWTEVRSDFQVEVMKVQKVAW